MPIKKLGIAVVYLLDKASEPLLDLHLAQIERCTEVPFTIYACALRLHPDLLTKLQDHPSVTISITEPTRIIVDEHRMYLDRLVRLAAEDGCTHIATFDVDSFPIQQGWALMLAERLTDQQVLAAVLREENHDTFLPHPCGMLFERAFLETYQPSFLLDTNRHSASLISTFAETYQQPIDTGIGYALTLFEHNLDWHRLTRSNAVDEHYIFAAIYGDLFFHLGALARQKVVRSTYRRPRPGDWRFFKVEGWLIAHGSDLIAKVPMLVKGGWVERYSRLIGWFRKPWKLLRVDPETHIRREIRRSQRTHRRITRQLLRDPQRYITYLRTGQRMNSQSIGNRG